MNRRVVITGIGPATALGIGKNEFFNSIMELKTHIVEIPESYEKNYTYKSRFFVPGPKFSLAELGIQRPIENMLEEAARLAVLCSKLALEDAGFKIIKCDRYFQVDFPYNSSVIMGIGMSSLETALESYVAHIADTSEDRGENKSKYRYNRMVIPMLMPNSASAWLSILFGIKGFNYTVNASCSSGSIAIGEAYRNIVSGRCDAAITGGVDALADKSGALMRGFDMLTTLTRTKDGRPQPFSEKRSGFLFNEGAGCVLVLEELQNAQNRGADIYAEIVGYECSSDAYSIVQMEPSGESITMLFKKLASGVKIDYLNAHGTATISNDDIEVKVIQDFFGDRSSQPYINSTKGILGHSIGASGALEAAIVAMSIKHSKLHGNLIDEPIDNLNLPLKSLKAEINYALSASYGFGGHNALLLFKRFDENE